MSHRGIQSARFSVNLSALDTSYDSNDPVNKWDDIPVNRWDEVIKMYGQPTRIIQNLDDNDGLDILQNANQQIADSPLGGTQTVGQVGKLPTAGRRDHGPPAAFLSDRSMRLLRQREFKATEYVQTIFGNEGLDQIQLAIDNLQGGGESEVVIRGKIADNLHNYVKAYEDLLNTQKQFREKQFPGQQDVSNLLNDVNSIIEKMNEFFSDIREQSVKAQNASALLSRISTYSFIFKLSSEIDNFRTNLQFDEIARVMQKANQFPYLKNVPLFAEALANVEKSLRNVEDSLQTKLSQMTYKTFNKSYCRLLLDITRSQQNNPIIKMLHSIDNKVRQSLADHSFNDSCSALEESLPFWKVLCDFFEEYYSNPTNIHREKNENGQNQYEASQAQINELLIQLITDFNKEIQIMLNEIKETPLPPGVIFNSELHNAVRRVHLLWADNAMPFQKANVMTQSIMNDLQEWYIKFLKDRCNDILNAPESGTNLTNFLLQMLSDSDIFSSATYKSIVLDPIYDYFDNLHEDALINDKIDLVPAIYSLTQLSQNNIQLIFRKYNKVVKEKLTEEAKNDLASTGLELSKLLINKLIRNLNIELNTAIHQGMFSTNIDWNAEDLQVRPDGWVICIINKCIECKCNWGQLFEQLRSTITQNIASSILHAISCIDSVSQSGRARIELNINATKKAFGSEPAPIWQKIEETLPELCTVISRALRTEQSKAEREFFDSIRLQLHALNPSSAFPIDLSIPAYVKERDAEPEPEPEPEIEQESSSEEPKHKLGEREDKQETPLHLPMEVFAIQPQYVEESSSSSDSDSDDEPSSMTSSDSVEIEKPAETKPEEKEKPTSESKSPRVPAREPESKSKTTATPVVEEKKPEEQKEESKPAPSQIIISRNSSSESSSDSEDEKQPEPTPPPKKAEPKKAEPKKEEPKKEEPKKAEPKKEEPKKAEPKKEEPKKEEPKKEEPKKEEPKKEEPKKEEPKKEEPKKEEPKKEEPKKEEKPPHVKLPPVTNESKDEESKDKKRKRRESKEDSVEEGNKEERKSSESKDEESSKKEERKKHRESKLEDETSEKKEDRKKTKETNGDDEKKEERRKRRKKKEENDDEKKDDEAKEERKKRRSEKKDDPEDKEEKRRRREERKAKRAAAAEDEDDDKDEASTSKKSKSKKDGEHHHKKKKHSTKDGEPKKKKKHSNESDDEND